MSKMKLSESPIMLRLDIKIKIIAVRWMVYKMITTSYFPISPLVSKEYFFEHFILKSTPICVLFFSCKQNLKPLMPGGNKQIINT